MGFFKRLEKRLDNSLEADGKWRELQKSRRREFIWRYPRSLISDTLDTMERWVTTHFELDLAVQRLIGFLIEEDRVNDQIAVNPKAEENYIKELEALQPKIEDERRKVFKAKTNIVDLFLLIPDENFRRSVETTRRNNPDWSLSEWLRSYCAGKGGCCGRTCGCCEGPRHGIETKGFGHCTSACVCCEQARGFHIDTSKGDAHLPQFKIKGYPKIPVMKGVFDAIVWGL
ncbi:hypothetical protein P170DRAFT_143038 [Aspergillus steynii IBT 23096]|uniref:Uncharacterized protein n=1 Tax=Aspergillus steynii IBT 23096 TaxID=1392250 RepID=A0A2I2GBZ3_9EURO|nr:uncharacterized protein P170DRAFT_143038 [Aspergillus steynii IBT 23096]PLB50386.1 hypothetical protein P170DRAFT_143038 [Aspergillus steynii IBT 23096]